ncbi:MAG: proton-conducting transporter membrane subunit [Coriobacteriia bacterium]|nr:proton-conducting transporter membrane subunit [Coriobacteriia bacterium]
MDLALPLAAWLVPVLVLGGVVLGLVADALDRRPTAIVLIALGLGGASVAGFVLSGSTQPGIAMGVLAYGSGFTALPALGYGLAALAVTAGYRRYATADRGPGMAALIALGAVFAHALLASLNLIVLFVSLSGLAIVAYALVAGAGTRRAEESAVRYFVQGTIASGLTLYGLALVFGLTGGDASFLTGSSALGTAESRPALLALALVLSAFAFKLGAFPFHAWVPDAYENADSTSAAFLSSVPKMAALVALLVIVRGTLFQAAVFAPATSLLVAIGVGSLLFGSFGMVRQQSVARLLGYSGIAQVGYGLLAISSGDAGIQATIVFIVTYAVGASAAFIALEAVGRVRPGWDGTRAGMAGIARRSPALGAALSVAMLSLTGIPLFAGFWGKLHVFAALLSNDSVVLAIVAGVAAVVSFGGYGSVIRAAYFEDPSVNDEEAVGERGGAPLAVSIVLALAILALGIVPLLTGISRVYALFGL